MKKEAETLAIQIEKLKESEPVISTGLEYDELYELCVFHSVFRFRLQKYNKKTKPPNFGAPSDYKSNF